MKGTRHREEQIIAILKQDDAGLSTPAGRPSIAGWTVRHCRPR